VVAARIAVLRQKLEVLVVLVVVELAGMELALVLQQVEPQTQAAAVVAAVELRQHFMLAAQAARAS